MGDIINACASPEDWLASWQLLSAIGLIMSWFVVSLIYMIGSLLDNIGLMARAKAEVWEIITTTIILGLVIALVTSACTFEIGSMGAAATSGNMFDVAENYLLWLRNYTISVFKDLMTMNSLISVLLSVMGGFQIYGIGIVGQPFAGLQPIMNLMNLFMNGIMICLIISIAQITVLKFIQAGAFNILLPIGIVCRSFPFTRRFGGSMIALAIGLFIIYPFLLVINDAIMGTPSNNPTNVPTINYSIMDAITGNLMSLGFGLITGGVGFLYAIADILTTYFVQKPVTAIGQVALAAFILPALNSVVFVMAVRDLSRILGQEVDVTSMSRMV
ncbi:MAG: hypothetical protein ABIG39_04010 [Candidatus Micrarchaeota archaeon]